MGCTSFIQPHKPSCACSILPKFPDPSSGRAGTSRIWVHILRRPLKKEWISAKTLELWTSAFGDEGKIPFYFCPDHDSEEDLSLQSHSFFEEAFTGCCHHLLGSGHSYFWCLKRQVFIPHGLCSVLCLFFQPASPSAGLFPPLLQLKLQNKARKK